MTTTVTMTDETIKGLLCSAFEGGSNYWYLIKRYEFGDSGLKHSDFRKGGKMQDPNNYWHSSQLIPLADGCAVIIGDCEGEDKKEYRLDRAAIQRGIATMAEKYPQHFGDAVAETGDATTGDVFLQCCLFGEAIYG